MVRLLLKHPKKSCRVKQTACRFSIRSDLTYHLSKYMGRGHMPFLITSSFLSFILVLLFRSFFRRRGYLAGNGEIENPEIKNRAFDISSAAIGAFDSGCKAYVIQSLYSKHFIFPEDAGFRKYEFRDPLPTFGDGYNASINRTHKLYGNEQDQGGSYEDTGCRRLPGNRENPVLHDGALGPRSG